MVQYIFFTFFLLFPLLSYPESSNHKESNDYSILSLGSAIIDHCIHISENELRLITNEKGTWAPIDYPTLCSILDNKHGIAKMIPGGCSANVMKGLAQLGEKCAIIGKVGSDDKGEYYIKATEKLGVSTYLQKGSLPTGQAILFITPDGQSTLRTYLGSSHNLTALSIDPKIFNAAKLLHIEGYQLIDQDFVIRSLKMAKNANLKISICLGNVEIVRRYKPFILKILEKYVDIIFCDESQASALTGLSAHESCSYLSNLCEISVVTMGEKGAWAQKGGEKYYSPSLNQGLIDITGATDLYASGFLHGYLKNASLKKCAWMGSLCKSYVIKRFGAEIPVQIWDEIRQRILDEGTAFDNS